MKNIKTLKLSLMATSILSLGATSLSAADLEFYFPVGVNAPAVATIEELTNEWAKRNPQHTIKAIYTGNYEQTTTKALTAAQAGSPPHIAVLLAIDLFTLIEEGVVVPISDLLTTTEEKEWLNGFYQGFMKDAQFEGKTYAIPFQRSTPVLYYNKDAFREAGLDPNSPPKSWEDMITMGKKLTKKDSNGNVTQWGTRIPTLGLGGAWLFGGLVASEGDVLSTATGVEARFDTPAAISSLKFLKQLADEEVMMTGGISWGDTPKAFLEGQAASIWTSTGNLTFINNNANFDWGVGFLPGGSGPGASTGGGNFYIFDGISAEEKAASLDFIKFMTSATSAAKWSIATGYVAPRPDTWETSIMKEYAANLPQALVALDQLPYAEREFATFQRAKVTQYLVEAIEGVVTGQIEPEKAVADAQNKADKVLNDYR